MWTKARLIVAAVLVMGMVHDATAGQLGYWAFNEGTGTTVADSSGNGNNGRFVGAPVWATGKIGKALQFDGVDDYVEVPHSPKLEPTTGKATVSVWINAKRHTGPNNQQWQGILAKGGAPRLYNLYTQQNQTLHFSTGASGAYIGSSSTGLVPLNEWVHVAVVVDNAHRYYLNGEPAGTGGAGARVPTGTTANLTIGRTNETQREFQGMIDEVRLYDVALSAAEVKALYNGNPPQWPKARDPKPADKAVGVQTPLLEWTPGDGAAYHNIYVGTSPDLTEADRFQKEYPLASYWHIPGLESGVTYYWRVDEVTADKAIVTTGDVWSFTAMPTKAYAPSPADGAKNVRRDAQLAWSPATDVVSHDVYFGVGRDEVAAGTGNTLKGNQSGATFNPGALAGDTTYYWRIDGVKTGGVKLTGDVWSFRTMPEFTISDPNLVGWWKLDGEAGAFVTDFSGRDNHGALQGNPKWVPGYDGGALDLDGVDDYVEVPHHDVLTVNKEAAVMAWINVRNLAAEYQGIIAKGNAVRSYSLYVQRAGTMHFSTTSAGAYVGSNSTGTITPGEWTHVCAMVKGGSHQYFINGEAAGTGASGIVLPGVTDVATVRIGNSQEDGRVFSGMIDDARIYNVALTQDQLKEAMQGDPLRARAPQPANNTDIDVRKAEALTWTAGKTAARHDVYFGRNKDAVEAADTNSPEYQGRQADTSFSLAGLVEFGGGDYLWRIDEVEADGVTIHKGPVWEFTVLNAYVVDDMESYTDEDGSRIYQTWLDGFSTQDNGSTVGYLAAPFAETKIVHGGKQSMPFDYNNLESPYYSEAELEFASQQNWTLGGVDTLSIWFRGNAQRLAETEPGRYTISATGNDIWGNADNFRFVYKQLNGDGSIVAKVNAITNSTTNWAKAGVMIRETLDPASTYAFMFPTPDGKRAFQSRPSTAGNAVSVHSNPGAVTFPVWVKVERKGSQFTASYSQDGKTWTVQPINETVDGGTNPQIIGMAGTVYVGMAVASNNAGVAACFGDFSDVVTTGSVGGQWKVAGVGTNPGNDRDKLYVVLSDANNKTATVAHPDPAAVNLTAWTEWKIPLSGFTGVNLTRVKKFYLGVGDRKATAPTGIGLLYIDDIRLTKP